MGVLRPDLMMKCIVPVVMAGIIAIYGLVVSVLISGDLQSPMALYTGFIQLGAGLSVGLAGLAAGFAVGIVGDAGVRGVAQQVRAALATAALSAHFFSRGPTLLTLSCLQPSSVACVRWNGSDSYFRRGSRTLRLGTSLTTPAPPTAALHPSHLSESTQLTIVRPNTSK